jgi:protein ImuA
LDWEKDMSAQRAELARLKAHLAAIEPRRATHAAADVTAGAGAEAGARGKVPLALLPGALHEVRIEDWRARPAAFSFSLALAARRARETKGAIVFLQRAHDAKAEGLPFARGLSAFGVALDGFLAAFARDEKELLWAAEEAARDRSVAAILALAPTREKRIDLTATRRLSLAAEASGAAPILIRTMTAPLPTSAAIRWRLEPAPSAPDPDDDRAPGPPRWRIFLERRRAGAAGGAPMETEWRHDLEDFAVAQDVPAARAPLSVPRPLLLGDGSREAQGPCAAGERRAARSL